MCVIETDTLRVTSAFPSCAPQIVLSPLGSSDGFLSIRVYEKTTFGDDVLLGERNDLQVSSFCSRAGERLVCTCGDTEVVLRAAYMVPE